MKHSEHGLAKQYQRVLRKHLQPGSAASLRAAKGLGLKAVSIGLETLDMARIHQQALETIGPGSLNVLGNRANAFFAEAITPLEDTHRIARKAEQRVDQLERKLSLLGKERAAYTHQLKRETVQRKLFQEALKKSEQHYSRLLDQSRQMQEQLRQLSRQLLSAQEDERKRISRELHDVIAQILTRINVELATLKTKTSLSTTTLARSVGRTQRLVARSVDIVHQFARELRPTVLDDLGLIPALHSFMKTFRRETGIHVSLSAFGAVQAISSDNRTVLYRVAQEALNNVARHAGSTRVSVTIRRVNGALEMRVKDDGKGFAQGQTLRANTANTAGRLGLIGMRERLEMVGGSFSVVSSSGKGTLVQARIPLESRRARLRK